MIEMMRAYPAVAPVIGDLIAKNLDWPGADEIARRLQAMQAMALPGGASKGGPPAAANAAHQQQLLMLQKSLSAAQSELQAAKTDRALDSQRLQIDAYKAETERMKVASEAHRDAMARTATPLAPRSAPAPATSPLR